MLLAHIISLHIILFNHTMFSSVSQLLSLLLARGARSTSNSIPLPLFLSSVLSQQQAHSYSRSSRLTKTFQRTTAQQQPALRPLPDHLTPHDDHSPQLPPPHAHALQNVLQHEALVVTRAIEW